MKNNKFLLLLILLFIITSFGCNSKNTSSNIALPNPSERSIYLSKLNVIKTRMQLFEETTKYTELSSKEINAINVELNSILKEILKEPESRNASEKDIIGGNNDFYISFRKPTQLNNYTFRFIEYGMTPFLDGSEIHLYLQVWDKDNNITLLEPHTFIQTSSSTGKYLYYGAIQKGNEAFLNIINNMNGADYNYLNLIAYKLNSNVIEKIDISNNIVYPQTWVLEKNDINSYRIYQKDANTYTCKNENNKIYIDALDNNNNKIDNFSLQIQ